ncbi:hypothetical protein [Variovorax saccharolyticus]|uniref:hypothetical protein n=1 Tax=Variovorax saccharolyticus TaxID=3053516 RepID=UPI0025773656|nr:hypothetical protein [Variovorax sp. J22R187]MDM0019300.1 hypothetical protein [Variovorax sp. J22R187]
MSKLHFASAAIAFAVAAGLLSGCETAPTRLAVGQAESFAREMAEIDAVAKSADKDGAIHRYQQLAAANPGKAEPWARIAQIRFGQSAYSLAIQAAEEALARDPSNREAKSVNAVAGLRLAARSLESLRADSSLTGDAHADAQQLAGQLRETLGTPVLLPAAQAPPPKKKKSERRARPGAAPAAQTRIRDSGDPASR